MYRDLETLKYEVAGDEYYAELDARREAERQDAEPDTEDMNSETVEDDAYIFRTLESLSIKEQTAAIAADAARIREIRLSLIADLAAMGWRGVEIEEAA